MSFAKYVQVVFVLSVSLLVIPSVWAQKYSVLYSFTGGSDGASPKATLVLDSAGSLYGTTFGTTLYPFGQTTGTTMGSVFKVSSSRRFTLLYDFGAGGQNGSVPSGGLVRDTVGNLYGATRGGGASADPNCFAGGFSLPLDGCGEIFKVDADGNFSVVYSFSGDNDCWHGCWPLAPLTLDPAGNLYGTTYLGGSRNCDGYKLNAQGYQENSACGVVFKLSGTGNETVLRRFGNARKYGDFPNSGLILDSAGNLYGTTLGGGFNRAGNGGDGTVFKLDSTGNETVLFFFQSFVNAPSPNGNLVQDAAGNLYGTTESGAAFSLDTFGNLTRLSGLRGITFAPVIMDAAGNLYGVTYNGGKRQHLTCDYGSGDGCGTVFKLDSLGNLTTLYKFAGHRDGANPYGGLVMDAAGNLYGTTEYGGTINSNCPAGCGVVFKITP